MYTFQYCIEALMLWEFLAAVMINGFADTISRQSPN